MAKKTTKKPAAKKTTKKKTTKKKAAKTSSAGSNGKVAKYPRHTLEQALRIPSAILDQNAGQECEDKEALEYAGLGWNGPSKVELSSALKYGFLDRPGSGQVVVSELAKKILRPQNESDELEGKRTALLNAPEFSEVYKHYRGENLPDMVFLENKLTESFGIPSNKVVEFVGIFEQSLDQAKVLEEHAGKKRVVDFTSSSGSAAVSESDLKKISKKANVQEGDSCFVMMPFANPLGSYYKSIYEPAIEKANLKAVRADAEIFGTGKIVDQIWQGISSAKVLVAELTSRNPNVFYELGIAHALKKPVVLVSSNEEDVPFDLQHVRVIYYDTTDPFWGKKLIDKVAENILSALGNPEEAVLFRD